MTGSTSHSFSRSLRVAGALVGVAVALGACVHDNHQVVDSVPTDYRLRHPIAVEEANQSIVVFVGRGRGGLTAEQRADVPVNTPNAAAAADAFHEVQSLLAAGGVPPGGIIVHRYRPNDPRQMATIRLTYSRMSAVAGPCGLWPEDLGPSIHDKSYIQNQDYYNFGCAYQRNMAAMIDNPSDLVQPRAETPAYTERRAEGFEKYRKGETSTTNYPEADKAKLSDLGK